jgi:rod shape-determining protein MreD
MLSQCLVVFMLLTGYQFIVFWVDGATGNPVTNFSRWLAPIIGALLWPVLISFMGKLHER